MNYSCCCSHCLVPIPIDWLPWIVILMKERSQLSEPGFCSFFIIWECALWHYLVLTGHYLEPKTQVLTTVWKLSLVGTLSASLLCSDAHLHLGFFVSVIYFAVWFVGMTVGFSRTFVKDKCQKHRWNRSWQAGTSNKWAFQIYRARLQQQAEPLLYCTTKAFGKGDSPGDISV